MSVKVVDLNTETVKEEAPKPEPIEEATKEEEPEVLNEVVETEEPKEEVKEEVKEEKPKRQTQKDRIQCPKCLKEVSLKTYRYSHEKICQGQLSEKPVKPHTNPRPKTKPKPTPKPPPEVYYSYSSEDDDERQPVIKKKQKQHEVMSNQRVPQQNINPINALADHYHLLQQQLIQQRQEKYNKICQGLFAPRIKRR